MNLSNQLPEKVSKPHVVGIRALMAAIALHATSCISPRPNNDELLTVSDIHEQMIGENGEDEGDMNHPTFIALVGISAEIQAELEYAPENRTLQHVWEITTERLSEIGINKDVSVSLIAPTLTGRGYTYIIIECDGQQSYISAKNMAAATERTQEMQKAYLNHIETRIGLLLGDNPATEEQLSSILESEEIGLRAHRMIARVDEDSKDSWVISFDIEM